MGRAKKVGRAADVVETTEGLAAAFAEWRGSGMPGYGFAAEFKGRVERAARAQKVGYGVLWAEVHRLAYERIDADARVR